MNRRNEFKTSYLPAPSDIGSGVVERMTNEQFRREKNYRLAMSIATTMLKRELITESEYKTIGGTFVEKYKPVIGSLDDYSC